MTEMQPPTTTTTTTTIVNSGPTVGQGLSIASMVLGIVGVFFFWIFAIIPILAIVFGGVAMYQQSSRGSKMNGMAIAGLSLGIIFTTIYALILIAAW